MDEGRDNWVPADDLLAYARDAGYDPSRAQLERWHKRDVLPRPDVRYVTGRRGRETIYPPETADLLLEVCELEEVRTPLADVAWTLWWRGRGRPMGEVRDYLGAVCDDLDKTLAKVRHSIKTESRMPGSVWSFKTYALQSPDLGKPLGTFRRRLNWGERRDFPRFMELVTSTLLGNAPELEPGDRELLEDSLYLDGLRKEAARPESSFTRMELGSGFRVLAELFRRPLRAPLDAASDDELAAARDHTKLLFAYGMTFGETMRWAFGKKGLGFGYIGRTIEWLVKDPKRQAFMVILGLTFLKDRELSAFTEEVQSSAHDWLDQSYPRWRLLRVIADEVPALREPLSPRRFVELHRSPGKLAAYTEEVERLAVRHRAAIDAVIERHPDLAAAAGMESL